MTRALFQRLLFCGVLSTVPALAFADAVSSQVNTPVVEAANPLASMDIETYRDRADQIRQTKAHTKVSIQISVLTSEEASKLFMLFKNDNRIPWNYTADGCYARAEAMALLADRTQPKIVVGKVFAYGKLSHNWQYHVATIAYVNGTAMSNLMVFDPSLFGQPVSIATWNSVLDRNWRVHEKQGKFTWGRGTRFQYKPHGYMQTSYSQEDLKDAADALRKFSSHSR